MTATMKAVNEVLTSGQKALSQYDSLLKRLNKIYKKNGNGCLYIHKESDLDEMTPEDYQAYNDAQLVLRQITNILQG